ncbi:hypothetical protein IKF40_00035 [Candidatus Saccharibacteria bacterium]|nr:hypothetical protein [Candidatus Saccharibacteria bacterium]
MGKRLILVYNPRSSKHDLIETEVLVPARKLKGYTLGKFEVAKVPVDENARNLAKILTDGDLVVVAGGDGSATVGLNAIMLAQQAGTTGLVLGVTGYGNFNDMARMLGQKKFAEIIADFEDGKTQKLFPLEAMVDGKHFRYAGCYFTLGMFSESTEVFDVPNTRETLKRGNKSVMYSLKTLAGWYFKNHRKEFLPGDIQMNGIPMNRKKIRKSGRVNDFPGKHVSDILFVNGKTVAKVMRGGDFWLSPDKYYVALGRLKGLFRLAMFMAKSVFSKLPGHVVRSETRISFSGVNEVEIQAEGEYKKMKMQELVIKKAKNSITVVV